MFWSSMHTANNFDFLRLIFALFVIVTHSYALTGVSEQNDLLYHLTNGAFAFSTLGVCGFFIISGYLIFESLKRSHSLSDYFIKRTLRIFPGLGVVLLIAVAIGAFLTTIPVWEYITNLNALSYFLHNISLINVQRTINGVYESNPLPGVINGALWTISYEFLFYVLLSFLFHVQAHNKRVVLGVLLPTFILVLVGHLLYTSKYYMYIMVPYTSFNMSSLPHFGLYFASGVILSVVGIDKFRYKKHVLIIALVLSVGLIVAKSLGAFSYILLPPLIIIFGLQATKGLADIKDKVGGGFILWYIPIRLVNTADPSALL